MPRSAATAGRRSSVERLVSPLPGRKGLSRGLMESMMAAVEPASGESRLKGKGEAEHPLNDADVGLEPAHALLQATEAIFQAIKAIFQSVETPVDLIAAPIDLVKTRSDLPLAGNGRSRGPRLVLVGARAPQRVVDSAIIRAIWLRSTHYRPSTVRHRRCESHRGGCEYHTARHRRRPTTDLDQPPQAATAGQGSVRHAAAIRTALAASRSTPGPAPGRCAASDSWRRQARAPGRPLNSPKICRVIARSGVLSVSSRSMYGSRRSTISNRLGAGVRAAEQRVPTLRAHTVLVGRAADHHAVDPGELGQKLTAPRLLSTVP